ncbi:uncharacterized protein F4807DRAFT_423594 [Annulohypoxylon truncatum]|uniref:uncharacterized protein n=1 Tax=Annulohypoxylon truncatum TaxID=327061 RepID=UPI0020084449|nr:uncharacterized protein F4807DRAFT_423594 [Annulohypoxylon truncatum]KAI1210491.1 hypothetical protein F4807DRAFT_423594 [Annulohypoxylon truncatum]
MASRRVIADSDDEDGDDRPLTPLREDAEIPPEIEPLSPQLPDTQKPISDTTDQSFFASVYDEQQSRAFEQSQLIEQIVRQSQKASGGSDVSHPAKGIAKKPDASSASDVTTSVALDNLGNQSSLFNGASGDMSPRKSTPGEWDVPSSAENATTSKPAKSSKGKDKSYGKQKRTPSKFTGSSATAKMFMGNDPAHGAHPTNNEDELSPRSATKRRKVSLHDSVLQDMPAPANFYIAQSNLTTMQKLEYQRVNVSQNVYSGLPVTLPNPKSSGVSTVAYSTPSRYASSGPPLPWERSPIANTQPAEIPDVINIASSPDVIAADHHRNAPMADMGPPYISTHTVAREVDARVGGSTMGDLPNKKRKRPKDIQDEDELVQDQSWDLNTDNSKQDNHKRQRHNEHWVYSPSLNEDDGEIELISRPHEELPPREMECEELPGEDIYKIDEPKPETSATEPYIPALAPEPIQLEAQPKPAPQPKKRGRKKKQPTNEQTNQVELPVQNQATDQDPNTAAKASEDPAEPVKAKKGRGRPRKSELAKTKIPVAPVASEPEPIVSPKTPGNDVESEESTSERTGTTKKPKNKEQAQKQEGGNVSINEPTANENGDRDASPLKEISSNTRTQSQKSMSTEAVHAKPATESPASPNIPPKSQEKAHAIPKPTPTASQPKVPYRVGLSKRTRIASLLKVIKR